jgi:DNA-binding transcriptional ArsR family regulator
MPLWPRLAVARSAAETPRGRNVLTLMRPKDAATDKHDERGRHALAELFRTLADPGRLRIVLALAERGEMYAGQLTRLTGLSHPATSFHLSILRAAGLTEFRRDGRYVFYRIASEFNDGPMARLRGVAGVAFRLGPVSVRVSSK